MPVYVLTWYDIHTIIIMLLKSQLTFNSWADPAAVMVLKSLLYMGDGICWKAFILKTKTFIWHMCVLSLCLACQHITGASIVSILSAQLTNPYYDKGQC